MLKVFSAMVQKFSKILAVSKVTKSSFHTDDSQFWSDVQTSLLTGIFNSVYVKWHTFVYERKKKSNNYAENIIHHCTRFSHPSFSLVDACQKRCVHMDFETNGHYLLQCLNSSAPGNVSKPSDTPVYTEMSSFLIQILKTEVRRPFLRHWKTHADGLHT